ncbi:MAG: ExbD/TolR family protein [Hyphomonas sp.]
MAFSSQQGAGAKCDMNVVPLIDVLLVLLIIFMVTVPAVSYQIQIDLPQASRAQPEQPKDPPPPISLRIDANGEIFKDGVPVLMRQLTNDFIAVVNEAQYNDRPQPTLEIETNPDAQYQVLAEVLAIAKNAGMEKIGFVENLR